MALGSLIVFIAVFISDLRGFKGFRLSKFLQKKMNSIWFSDESIISEKHAYAFTLRGRGGYFDQNVNS